MFLSSSSTSSVAMSFDFAHGVYLIANYSLTRLEMDSRTRLEKNIKTFKNYKENSEETVKKEYLCLKYLFVLSRNAMKSHNKRFQ